MTYEEFILGWVNKALYECHKGDLFEHAGVITMREEKYKPPGRIEHNIMCFFVPTWAGWKDDAQRRRFYRDAKKVGIRAKTDQPCEWYKILN